MNRRELFGAAGALVVTNLLPTKVWAAASKALAAPISASSYPETAVGRSVLSLNKGWRFFEGDVPFPVPVTNSATYDSTKTGAAGGAAGANFDDTEWQSVTLPHDFVSYQPVASDLNVAQGFRQRGVAWYRNTLRFDESDLGKHIELQLDGIATYATVWFNGTQVRQSTSGYMSNYIDVTAFATYGDALNSLAIRVDAKSIEGWWYEGGGMYRHTWVVKRSPVHIITDGVYALPVKRDDNWAIPVEVTLYSIDAKTAKVDIVSELKDVDGTVLASAKTSTEVAPLEHAIAKLTLAYVDPKLWSVDTPNLYQVHTKVLQDGKLIDETIVETGFRTLHFDAQKGLFLNGQHIKVQGVCNHQDHAGVGVAIPDALWAYRLRRLKELGVNALRCSHNAPSNVFLRLADRMGFLVMDENRMFNPSPQYLEQLEWMVRRDRNHPSVYLWSVFNEEPMQGTLQGYELVRRMSAAVKSLDTNRPVTAAMNGGFFNKHNVAQAVDVVGLNYHQEAYDGFHAAHPDIPMFSSEDTSAFMTRGEYVSDREGRHVIASYDDDAAPWGERHLEAWKAIDTRDFVAGGFVWTGFDYHGEPTPLTWPANSSVFGIMDLCGFEKAAFYMHQSQWVKDRPVLWLIPHWNWPGKEGQPIRVMAMTNLDEVELFLNGKLIGRQKVDKYAMNTWQVPYAPGRLEVVGYKAGKVASKAFVETAGATAALRIVPERSSINGDGIDVMTFRVEAEDAKGRFMPLAQNTLTFAVDNGDIIGVGNGDQNSQESEKGNKRSLFNGLAQVIVQSREGSAGRLTLRATADGLKTGHADVKIVATAAWPYQVVNGPVQTLPSLYIAPATDRPPRTIPQNIAERDMELWPHMSPGFLSDPIAKDGYSLAVTRLTPYVGLQKQGAVLKFSGVKGAMDVYVDGELVAQKTDPAETLFSVKLSPKRGERNIALLFRVKAGEAYGLPGLATFTQG